MRLSAEKKIMIGFGLIVVILTVLAVFFYHNNRKYKESSNWVSHTHEVSYYSEQVLTSLIGIETGPRGYIITGDWIFLQPFVNGRSNIRGHIAKLKKLTSDNPLQQRRCDTLLEISKRRIEISETMVALYQRSKKIDPELTSKLYKGKSTTDDFREVIDRLQKTEAGIQRTKLLDAYKKSQAFNLLFIALLLLVVAVVGVTYFIISHHLKEREKSERTIQQNWQTLQSILDNTPAVVYIKDLEGRFTVVNKKFAESLGHETKDLANKTMDEVMDEKSASISRESDLKVIESKNPIQFEYNTIDNKASFLVSKFPLKDNAGQVFAICCIASDITETTKNKEQLLYQSQMINNASDAIIASDMDFNITFWNHSSENLYDIPAESAIGKNVFQLLKSKKELPPNIADIIKKQMWEQGEWRGEFEYLANEGTVIPISTATSFIKDSNGTPIGILSINRNIKEQKQQENAIKQLNIELEAFSYSVSHDLRTPLRSIDGYSRILLEEYDAILDDNGKKLTHTIIRNTVKMNQLIDDLLSFSRVSRKEIYKKLCNMNELLEKALQEFEHTDLLKNAVLNISPLPSVYVDINMFRQVWINLLGNALKYSSKKNAPIVEIGVENCIHDYIFYVRDNGVGFDMKFYDKLFGVFQRLHSSEEFEGTGVGLALVQRIVTKHGGKLWAEATVNEGATFYFSINKEYET